MSKQTEALKLALEALEHCKDVIIERGLNGNQEFAEKWGLTLPLERSEKAITVIREALAEQPAQQQKEGFASPGGGYVPAIPRPMPLDWKLVPRKATPEMLKAMDECAQEGYDERLYAGMASSVYMAAWDASPVLGTLPLSEKEKSMMDMIVGNFVREGINKHRARELAEHFIKQCNYTNGYCTGRTDLLSEQKAQQQEPDYKALWQQMCERCDELDAKLAQQQEPVAQEWRYYFSHSGATGKPDEVVGPCFTDKKEVAFGVGCFDQTALCPPASKPWVGLTDQEIRDWWRIENGLEDCNMAKLVDFTLAVRAIEAKLREKNA